MSTIDPKTYAASGSLIGGFGEANVIAPSDTVDLEKFTRGIWVGGVGNVVVNMASDDQVITFVAVPAGTLLPIRVSRVLLTGTDATSLIGLY
jgi:hypothetical protein